MSEDPVKMADDFAHVEANRDLDERERLIRKRTESVLALSQVDRSPLGQWPEDAAYLLDALDAARGKLEIEKSEVRDLSDILHRLFEMSRQFEDADGPTDSWYDLPTGVKQLWQERDAAREENGRLKLIQDAVLLVLRTECRELDANDWPVDLHPADVIEKYLVRGWRDENERLREALTTALEAMAPCVVGWEDMSLAAPSWVVKLRQAVLAVQAALGLPLDDGGAALAREDGMDPASSGCQ